MAVRRPYTELTTRISLMVSLFLLIGCGSSPTKSSVDPIEALEQQSSFLLRSNPCGCIINQPALDYEIKLHGAWKRVHIDSTESDDQTLNALRSYFYKGPKSVIEVQGKFLKVFYQWLPGHHAPSIRIDETVIE